MNTKDRISIKERTLKTDSTKEGSSKMPKELAESGKKKGGEISVTKMRKEGFGILKGVGPFTAEDELETHD
jgi:hypothetical protein